MKTTIYTRNNQEIEVNYSHYIGSSIIAHTAFIYSPWNGTNQEVEIEEMFESDSDVDQNAFEVMLEELEYRVEKDALNELTTEFDNKGLKIDTAVSQFVSEYSNIDEAILCNYEELYNLCHDCDGD